jgi:hypothetical protein
MAGSAENVGDAAALSLIDMRRIDRATGKLAKPGDLTHLLKHSSATAPPARMMAAPAPSAAPPRAAVAPAPPPQTMTHSASDPAMAGGIKRGDLTHLLKHASGETPPAPAAVSAAVPPRVPARAALAPETAAPPSARGTDDRAAANKTKRGDLTQLLKRPSSAAPPTPSVAPTATPAAAPRPAAPPPAPPPAPEVPARAAIAPEPAPPPAPRRAVALPEPYLAPDPELKPTYHVGGGFAVLPPLPAPPPRASESAAPLPYDDVRSVDDLVDYWDRLRGGRALPLLSRLDRTRIAISWPNTLLVSFDADQTPQLTRLSRLTHDVLVTSAVTEWILSCARRVARLGKAMETDRDFPGEPNTRQYQLLLLPFAGATGASDHMLCNLRRTG